jgi:hypothetical protein
VEVFDAPLDYNLLLGHSWIDSMCVVVSTLFRVVRFPHQGKLVTVDQLAFFNSDIRTGNVLFIAKNLSGYENVGVGLLKDSSLMGTFLIPPLDVPRPLVASINMISTIPHELPVSSNPWIVPDPGDHTHFNDVMPLSPVESTYQAIQSATPSTPSLDELSPDPFHVIFHTDEMIMSVMEDTPWDDGHDDGHHGKENFLRRFIPNYVEITRGFTQLLKKDSEFIWDTIANNAFEALKLSLTRAPLLFPPDYSRDYFLYLATSEYTIGMVLIQEDDVHDEHVIYYLS